MAIEYNRLPEGDDNTAAGAVSENEVEDLALYLRRADSHRRRWNRQTFSNPITNHTEMLGFVTATVVHERQQRRVRERETELLRERIA